MDECYLQSYKEKKLSSTRASLLPEFITIHVRYDFYFLLTVIWKMKPWDLSTLGKNSRQELCCQLYGGYFE